ncbi:MAG: DNA polymerase III subunit delta [Phycisphaerales bacterium]|nr:DNA polymerase III subunit delta [Phycisphaerales bacterium]
MAKKAAEKPKGPLGPHSRMVLLHGKEEFLQTLYTDQLKSALAEAGVEFDVARFDAAPGGGGAGGPVRPADVLDECRSMSLMQIHKVVIVDHAEELVKGEAARPLFERYAQHPAESATLVLRAGTWHKGKLDKLIEAMPDGGGVIIKCDEVPVAKAVAWAGDRAQRRYGRTLDARAAQLLVDRLGPDLARIDSELSKLSCAAEGGGAISAELVRELVGLSREEEVWEIQRVLLSGHAEAALDMLRQLLTVSKVPTVLLRFAYADLCRKLHGAARGLAAGMPPGVVGKALRLWGDSMSAVLDAARRMPPDRAAELLRLAVDADFRGKTGQGEEELALEVLTVRITSALAGRAA